MLLPFRLVSASEPISGSLSPNLTIAPVNQGVEISNEELSVKLHVGFAEVNQRYIIKNNGPAQKVSMSTKSKAANLKIMINSQAIPAAETGSFSSDFLSGENKTVEISYWQMNGAELNGLRTFQYSFKNNAQKIGNLQLRIELMDGLNFNSFDKNLNPALDIKLEPLGYEQKNNNLIWQWQDIVPGFVVEARFYWPQGDLIKNMEINQNLNLYDAAPESGDGWALSDSSYLTAAKIDTSPVILSFNKTRSITGFRILPGKAASPVDFVANPRPKQIEITAGSKTQTFEIKDELAFQDFSFTELLGTQSVALKVNTFWPAAATESYISEIEFKEGTVIPQVKSASTPVKKSWVAKVADGATNFFRSIKKIF